MKAIKRLLGVVVVLALAAGVGIWERPVSYSIGAMYLQEFFSHLSA